MSLNINRTATSLIVALSLVAVMAPATSYAGTFSDNNNEIDWQDDPRENGKRDLGRDISGVGHTSFAVSSYIDQLSPQAQRAIVGGCETALTYQVQVEAKDVVLPFCRIAITAAGHGG